MSFGYGYRAFIVVVWCALAMGISSSASPVAEDDVELDPLSDSLRVVCAGELDLKDVSTEECIDAINRSTALRSFVLRNDAEVTLPLLRALTAHSGSLQRLIVKKGSVSLSAEGVKLLSELSKLRTLELNDVVLDGITSEQAKNRLKSLRDISEVGDRDGNLITIVPVEKLLCYRCQRLFGHTLRELEGAHSLQVLCAEHYEIGDRCFGLIGKFSLLHTLELRSNSNGASPPMDAVAKLGQLQFLRKLVVAELPVDFDKLAATVSTLKELNDLRLDWMAVSESGLRQLSMLKSLQSLTLGNCSGLTDTGVLAICKASTIQRLDLSACEGLSSSILAQIAKDLRLKTLLLPLWFKDEPPNKGNPEWADSLLAKLGSLKSLEELVLPFGCTGGAFRALGDLPNLAILNIQGASTFNADDASRIGEFRTLRKLICSDQECSVELASAIGKCPQLVELEIACYSDKEPSNLSKLLNNISPSKLRSLTLSAPAVGSDLLKAIVRHESLDFLRLNCGTGCTAEHVTALHALGALSTLKFNVAKGQDSEQVALALKEFKAVQEIDVAGYDLSIGALKTLSQCKSLRAIVANFKLATLKDILEICVANKRLKLLSAI